MKVAGWTLDSRTRRAATIGEKRTYRAPIFRNFFEARHSGIAKRGSEPRGRKLVVCPWVPGSMLTHCPGMTKS